jgi:hypothetical protein
VSGYVMRAPTRTLMMSRVSRHHGTLRHSSSSIVGLPHIDARLPFEIPSLMVCLFYFHSSFLWSPVCINFNPGCYHLFLPLCCCITVVTIHKSCLIPLRSIHLHHVFPLCYVHFIYSPHSLVFIFILYHSSRAGTTRCCSTRLASCLLLHFS